MGIQSLRAGVLVASPAVPVCFEVALPVSDLVSESEVELGLGFVEEVPPIEHVGPLL